jgi:L-malate glycosyltransferase
MRNLGELHVQPGVGHVTGRPRAAPAGRMVGVLGVYGKGNLGDEALLLCVADDVRACAPDAEILAICSNPNVVRRDFGFRAMERFPGGAFVDKLRLVRSCRLLIIGGGTLLCDHASFMGDLKAIGAYFFWPALARLFGVPTVAYAQGLGPASHWLIRQAVRRVLPMAADITFRDSGSARLARSIAGDPTASTAACDPVVGGDRFAPENVARAVSPATRAWLATAGGYALVATRFPKLHTLEAHRDYLETLVRAIAAFQARSGAQLVLFPAHISEVHQDDRECIRYMKEALIATGTDPARISVTEWHDLTEAAAILQNAQVVVGDRLHALLLAATNGVPVVGFAAEDKIAGCLREIGDGKTCRVASPVSDEPALISAMIFEAWSTGPRERAEQRAAVTRWRAVHAENIACLRRYLPHEGSGSRDAAPENDPALAMAGKQSS